MDTQYAVIDSQTRIIKVLTVDPDYQVSDTEELITLPQPIDFATAPVVQTSGNTRQGLRISSGPSPTTTYYVLGDDNQTLTVASVDDIDQAGVDDARNSYLQSVKVQAVSDALDAVLADSSIPQSLLTYFQAVKDLTA